MLSETETASNDSAPGEGATERATVKAKWGGAVHESSGFVAVPMALLRLQSAYGLSSTDMMVLINLLGHWWEPSSVVFPRSSTIAKRLGVDKRTVQRAINKLQSKGLLEIERVEDGKRAFVFDRLVRRLSQDIPRAYTAQVYETFGDL